MQIGFERTLNPGFSRVRCPGVGGRVEALQVCCAQGANVTHGMCDFGSIRVVAYQARLEVDAVKSRPLYREVCDFFLRQPELERHGLEAGTTAAEFLEARDVFDLDQVYRRKAIQRVINIVDLLGYKFELVGWQILRKDAPLAIEDEAANRRYGLDSHPVTL